MSGAPLITVATSLVGGAPCVAPPSVWEGGLAHEAKGAHVAVYWGDEGEVDPADVAVLLDALEASWDLYVDTWDMPAPGEDGLAVYVGDTGGPSTSGAAGTFSVDADGEPVLVIAAAILGDHALSGVTAAHELFHAVQYATLAYRAEGVADWYWEASATWASGQVFPGEPLVSRYLYAAAFEPHLPWDAFAPVGDGSLASLRAYGAFILPQHLSEHVADAWLIRDSWVEADGDDPLVVLDGLLGDVEGGIASVFGDFAAANATWDYADGALYADDLREHEGLYAGEDARVALRLDAGADGGWERPPDALRPQRFGVNTAELVRPDAGWLTVAFAGDAEGTDGSEADFEVRVVREARDGVFVEPVPLEGGEGSAEIAVTGLESALFVTVAATAGPRVDGEAFGYAVSAAWRAEDDVLDTAEVEDGEPGGARACGCAAGGVRGGGGVLVALGLCLRRRTRRPQTR